MTNSFITINYHYVRPIKRSKYENINGLEIKKFIKQLNFLKKNYNIISTAEITNSIIHKTKLPKKSCLLTFDDGYKDHHRYVMPELIKRKISGCFFPSAENIINNKVTETNKIHFILDKQKDNDLIIKDIDIFLKSRNFEIPDKKKIYKNFDKIFKKRWGNKKIKYIKFLLQVWIPEPLNEDCCTFLFKKYVKINEKKFSKELYLSTKEIQEMINNGMTIGGHGYRHLRLGDLSYKNQAIEINQMLAFLNRFKINKNWVMCYPYGSFNNHTKNIIKEKGCLYGFSADPGKSLLSKKNIYNMNRFDTNDF
jgi:peptidoglycan/xylan/chitin deacetylase (PgdA/CDA1 family)|tara:strand:- start:1599 stop:2525 length:927 start_codon:yes stop_codon:yes gene_type:complete